MEELTGLTRQELISKIQKESLNKVQIIHALNTLKSLKSIGKPIFPKEGDIFYHRELTHPAVIISVKKNVVYAFLMSTNENLSFSTPVNSRFINSGVITSTLVMIEPDYACKNFIAVYENKSHLREIKNNFKLHIKTL